MVTWGHITKLGNPVDTWAASFRFLSDTDIKGVCSKIIEVIDASICLI